MHAIHWGGVTAVAGLYVIFLGIGALAARRSRTATPSDLLVAGRAMPLWVAVMTMTATWVDGGYLNGTAEGVYRGSLARALQPGVCYGLSLVLGGLFFARAMRRRSFTTLVDLLESRFGPRWSAVLLLPALLGEVFWSAELLVAVGSTFGVLLGLDLTSAVLVSAAVVTTYTVVGGMWSVAYTDAFQLALIPLGMIAALPFALGAEGGLGAAWTRFAELHPGGTSLLPPLSGPGAWPMADAVAWWDLTVLLLLGGIPWNCYFQRVLSCRTPEEARAHSLWAGALTAVLVIPPALLGMAAASHWGKDGIEATNALPQLLHDRVPYAIGVLGLTAIVGAVTSSFSASILSAGAMLSWNVYRRLLAPGVTTERLRGVIRGSVVLVGGGAALLALSVRSVLDLWIFCSDLIFVLLFPQLLWALYDPKATRTGSMVAFMVSLTLRLGGGEPLFGLPPLLRYPDWLGDLLPGGAAAWYDPATGGVLLPFRTAAMVAGLMLLPVVSRVTARWDPPVLGRRE